MSQEETLGLINGLAAVAKEQNASNKSRTEELKSLASAVKDLSDLINLQSQTSPVDEPISTANALPVTPVSAYPRKAPAHRQEATPKPPVRSDVGSQATCLLMSISPVSETLEDSTLSSESLYSTTVVIHSTKESAILPLNVSIGNIRPVLSTDTNVLEDAADFTASQLLVEAVTNFRERALFAFCHADECTDEYWSISGSDIIGHITKRVCGDEQAEADIPSLGTEFQKIKESNLDKGKILETV
eukprot:gene14919-6057_t